MVYAHYLYRWCTDNINENGGSHRVESPLLTVLLPKGAYRLVGGVTSKAAIVILSVQCLLSARRGKENEKS